MPSANWPAWSIPVQNPHNSYGLKAPMGADFVDTHNNDRPTSVIQSWHFVQERLFPVAMQNGK